MRKYHKPHTTHRGPVDATIYEWADIGKEGYLYRVSLKWFGGYAKCFEKFFSRYKDWKYHWAYKRGKAFLIEKMKNEIMREFFDKMLTDLIKNDVEFEMPGKNFRLSIGHKVYNRRPRSGYKFNVVTGGYDYTPRICFSQKGSDRAKRLYWYFKLHHKYQDMFDDEVNIYNHHYTNYPQDVFVKRGGTKSFIARNRFKKIQRYDKQLEIRKRKCNTGEFSKSA